MSLTRRTHLSKLELSVKNADALILGDPAAEGGDIKVYRDDSGNLQMSLDADAASNAKALDIYGGVVCQNYLTVGQAVLNTSRNLYIEGTGFVTTSLSTNGFVSCDTGILAKTTNLTSFPINIDVSGTDSTNHDICMKVDDNTIICARATGDGAGGITNKAIGLYGITPAIQAAAISDPAESTAGNNAAIDSILAALRGIGLIAT